jgi:hypothetical protein
MMIGFWVWLETYMVYSTLISIWPSYRVTIPGQPAITARLYWLGSPRVGGAEDLLVLTPKSSGRREFYCIDMSHRKIGLPECPKYVPLFDSAIVDRTTLEGYPLELDLKAEWDENETEVRIRIMGFSDRAMKPRPDDDENARRMMPIGYQREIVLTKVRSG